MYYSQWCFFNLFASNVFVIIPWFLHLRIFTRTFHYQLDQLNGWEKRLRRLKSFQIAHIFSILWSVKNVAPSFVEVFNGIVTTTKVMSATLYFDKLPMFSSARTRAHTQINIYIYSDWARIFDVEGPTIKGTIRFGCDQFDLVQFRFLCFFSICY